MIAAAFSALTSRAGLAATGLVVGYLYGHYASRTGEQVRGLQAEVATLRIDLAIAQGAADIAAAETATLGRLRAALKERIDAYGADLAKRSDDRCRLTGADVRRLHSVR